MKKTIYFSNPAYLSTTLKQLVVDLRDPAGNPATKTTIPIEDIGYIVLENPQITVTHSAINALLNENVVIITCNDKHLPNGMVMALEGNTLQSKRYKNQIEASLPLKKQLWLQTVKQKIFNQAKCLNRQGLDGKQLLRWHLEVRSGDSENIEARAAAYYWAQLFSKISVTTELENPDVELLDFKRERFGDWPNNLLNYGYAILRAVIARAVVGAGLLPTLGIHHKNQYNAYCLADDMMEPFRPSVDALVCGIIRETEKGNLEALANLTPEQKKRLLVIPVLDVLVDNKKYPLQIAAQKTASSLVACFAGQSRILTYPELI